MVSGEGDAMERPRAAERPIEFRVLGPVEMRVDGLLVDIGGSRQRRLLAVLLSRAGNVVETDVLSEYVWDDDDRPDNAVDAARTYLSRLRRSFGDAGLDSGSLLVTQAPGYRLATHGVRLDHDIFERLILQARSRLDSGDTVSALAALDDAIALWRGTPYQEFADRPWIEGEVTRLAELHRVAVEQRAAARLDLGAHAEVVGELDQLVAEEPLRARPVELLMLALYRSGRQAEALRIGSRYRHAVGDVGLDPPESVTDLESGIAASDNGLRPVIASADTIRGYRLSERIGEGSFSVVYRSVQPSLGREVAVKQIRAELADRPDFIRRFEAEAQLVAGLEHPHIVPLYDYWREPGSAYLVMRWLRGGTLEARLRRQRLDADESVTLATQIGSALAKAHRAGVEHRDVRSANVFVDEIGNNYLGDFGIATDTPRTNGGRADTRGLGVVLFEAVTGKRPGGNGDRPALSTLRPDLPPAVERVLLRAMVGAGDETYGTVEEFVDDYVTAVDGATLRRPGATVIPLAEDVVNPYKGLRAFQESDADHFRGRDRLIDRLLHQLAEPGTTGRLVAAVGPSGSGKSSLVRAGLIPRIRAGAIAGSDAWFLTAMIPGTRPFDELEAALIRIAATPTAGLAETMSSDPHGITRAVNSTLPDETSELLLVIDQFEELFTLAGHDARAAFLDGLVAAVTDPRSRLRIVITIRADHWHRPLQHPELAHLLETSAVTVTPMAADELERAIVDPARSIGVSFEAGLVADIVAEVHDQPGALPLMQYLLTELFDTRNAGLMEIETYRQIGGVTGSLARRADDICARSSETDQDAIRRLFSRLITPGEGTADTRRRVLLCELSVIPEPVIERYGAARLLTFDRDSASREPTVEVAHEALIREWPTLRAWVDDDRDALRALRHLTTAATEWDNAGRADTDLYRGARLEVAQDWADEHPGDLTELERTFLGTATRQKVRERTTEYRRVRRLRALFAMVATIAVIALIATAIAITQRERADDNAREASEQAAAAEDLAALESEARRAAETARDQADAARLEALDAEDDASAAREEAIAAGDEASTSRDEAVTQRMILQSANIRDDQPTLSMLLAREAYDRSPRSDTLGSLLTSLQRTDGYLEFMPGTETSSNDQWLGVLDAETVVRRTLDSIDVYDLPSRTLVGSTPSEALPIGFFATGSVGGGRFTTVTAEGDVVTIAPGRREPTPMAIPEGELAVATASGENGAVVVGYASGAVDVFSGPDLDDRTRLGVHPPIRSSTRRSATMEPWSSRTTSMPTSRCGTSGPRRPTGRGPWERPAPAIPTPDRCTCLASGTATSCASNSSTAGHGLRRSRQAGPRE
jgi:DNA-binding SARP family transcriptional activator/tRNA A-37 threonylcarbamoyl transferase component Bud32